MPGLGSVCELVLMEVRAAQEWDAIEDMFLEPFQPEIDDRRDVKRE